MAAMAAGRVLSLDEALKIAQAQAPERVAAQRRADAQRAGAHGAIGRMLPRLSVSEEYQRYKDPFMVSFGDLAFKARQRGTNSVSVAGAQPILGLIRLNEDRAAQARQADAARYDGEAAERTINAQVKTYYLQLFEARALAETAQASQATLNDQVAVADKKLAAGVLTRADVLRLQVAAANAKQEEISARAQERKVRASLLEELGLSAEGDSIDFAQPVALEAPVAPERAERANARTLALAQRPEVLSMNMQATSAEHRSRGRWLALMPEINLEAAYTHISGQILAPKDQIFVGVKADWAFWEWGATFMEGRSAAALRDAALADLDRTRRQVGVEVASRQADSSAAASAIEVSQLALQSAEEAFRVTQQGNRAGSATTTDLLDAEAALTRARLNVVRARYDYAIAQVALGYAMGEP
jgi:outer membrane protein TolC